MKQLFLFLVLSIPIIAYSQKTGRFQENVQFNENDYNQNRTLYYFVPFDYSPSKSYPLVIGLRGGPHNNAGEFRDQLTFLADSIGAIVVCPENIEHFNVEEGKLKLLYKYSVEHIASQYEINNDMIYLIGFSFGGRHSVLVSMDTDFGEIPKLRGVIPFAPGRDADLEPNYESIDDFPPACICIGLNDAQVFKDVASTLHNDIQKNGGLSTLQQIPQVAHSVEFSNFPLEILKCITFIEGNYLSNNIELDDLVTEFKIHPNPSSQQVYIDYPSSINFNALYITDLTGRIVAVYPPDAINLNIEDLQRGMYILVGVSNSEILSQVFQIEK